MSDSAPRVMCTRPPGAASALTPSVSSTMNRHGRFGRVLACASTRADQRDVFVDGRVLHDAVPLPNPLADRLAQLGLFLVGHLNVAHLLRALQHRPQLAGRRARRRCEPAPGPSKASVAAPIVAMTEDFMTILRLVYLKVLSFRVPRPAFPGYRSRGRPR